MNVQRVQELRRSNAAAPHATKKFQGPSIDEYDFEDE